MAVRSHRAVLKQLVRDTFRQAWASGICAMMLTVTGLCVLLCLTVRVAGDSPLPKYDDQGPPMFLPSVTPEVAAHLPEVSPKGRQILETDAARARHEGIDTLSGRMSLALGAVTFPVSRDRGAAVHFLELLLAGGIAGTVGLLMTLVWTAGFLPTFLEPSAASVLLAKPATRRQLLLGKYLGVLAFVGVQVLLFVGATWLALGVRTRVWDLSYWWCVPLLLVEFAIFYSFSVLLSVMTRSTVACVFGAVLFWLLAWGINYGSLMARTMPDSRYLASFTRTSATAAYWIAPKPIDTGVILFNALGARSDFEKPDLFRRVEASRTFSPRLSILSSLVMTAAFLALAVHEFRATDY